MKEKESVLDKIDKNLKLEKIEKNKSIQEKGITLIALVVTIVILLILAGVTLNIALSDNGLFSKTKEAVEKYKTAQQDEEEAIKELENQLGDITSNKPTVSPPTPTPKPRGPKGKTLVTEFTALTEKNEEAEDKLGNLITIPKGFKFLEGETVKEGIVIQDKDGNEFVWIPVSNIDGDNTKNNNEKEEDLISIDGSDEVEITLGRYTFDASNGTPHLEQKGSKCNESNHVISTYYTEYVSQVRTNGGVGAKDLQGFVKSVEKNHGYYIARYEAGGETNNKPVSKPNEAVWNNVNQSTASTAARGMYTSDDFTSDLINSYAWDTAIVYIQEMENKNYANENAGTKNGNVETGTSKDERCHIFDMAGSKEEWTTEYSINTYEKRSCVYRGGSAAGGGENSTMRCNHTERFTHDLIGFRSVIFLE